jgi:hypothetical protein
MSSNSQNQIMNVPTQAWQTPPVQQPIKVTYVNMDYDKQDHGDETACSDINYTVTK